MPPTPSLADRVLVLEERQTTFSEFRSWCIAIIAGGILTAVAGGVAYGEIKASTDNVAAELQQLRQDLNARAQVGIGHARSH